VIDPLRVSCDVACSPRHAFATWTERFGSWWPRGHTVSGEDGARVELEPRVGGRIYERTEDGTEIDWGEITAWDPPHRLAYLWHIRRDRGDATDVEIAFVPLEAERTRIDIVHTGWERLGADGPAWREANVGGWGGLLPHFVAACTTDAGPIENEGASR
jgi:uncharacterized protein YndB with AHSA1/START domain